VGNGNLPPQAFLGGGKAPARIVFGLVGVALGILGPAGLILLRLLFSDVSLGADLRAHAFFYLYQLIGASLAFGGFGLFLGYRVDALRKRRDWYREKADHDDLTGLLAPKAFRRLLDQAISDAERRSDPLTVLLIGVEGLRDSENERGPAATRALMLHVAWAARKAAGSDAVVGRWGGVELALLVTGVNFRAARELAAAVRDAIGDRPVVDAGGRTYWAAIVGGAAGVPTVSGDALLAKAQAALREAREDEECIAIREA
jgi:diguanylate cyclase (GGDEF)-like protein